MDWSVGSTGMFPLGKRAIPVLPKIWNVPAKFPYPEERNGGNVQFQLPSVTFSDKYGRGEPFGVNDKDSVRVKATSDS